MQYFSFDRTTGAFLGARDAQIDPLETERHGKTIFCRPGLTDTTVSPPETAANEAAVWNGSTWSIVPDHRKETWWQGSTEVVIDFLGDPAERGLSRSELAPEPPAATADNIKAECSRRIFLVANGNAQMNMASFAAAGLFNAAQMSAYASGLQWVAAMRAKCAVLIAAADQAFADDASWPVCPAAAAALAAQF